MPFDDPTSEPTRLTASLKFSSYQKMSLHAFVHDFVQAEGITAEQFYERAWDWIHAVTQDREVGLLLPITDDYGAPLTMRDIDICDRTIRGFLGRKTKREILRVRRLTFRFISLARQAKAIIEDWERGGG